MNILPAGNDDPVGAAALLGHADPDELDRFSALEDAVWGKTSLSPAVIETVRLHCARIRGCEFCAAARITAAIEDGLTEAHIERFDDEQARASLSPEQIASLTLVDHFLRDPRSPSHERRQEIAGLLGTSGVVEVLLACVAFASADLRIALGENRKPNGSGVFERARGGSVARSADAHWPSLSGAVLDPAIDFPAVREELRLPLRERVSALWSGADLPRKLVAACAVRSTQLLGVENDSPARSSLIPPTAAELVDANDVRRWPEWPNAFDRDVLSLAEQIWMDPSGVDGTHTDALAAEIGVDGVIRSAWQLILIGQLHRLALVLHRTS